MGTGSAARSRRVVYQWLFKRHKRDDRAINAMAKSDLRARPIFHHQRDAIEAHLTVVFAALAVSRHLQDLTGVSIKKLVRTLRPLRTVRVEVDGHPITAVPQIAGDARAILDQLPPITAPGH